MKRITRNLFHVTAPLHARVTYAALATKHGKEAIFQPAFATINISVVVTDINTDLFGTFAGEVEREGSARDTAERKARAAIDASGLPIGLASEGSFGPHPATPFLLADTETVVYVDRDEHYSVFETAGAISSVPAAAVIEDLDAINGLKITSLFPQQRAIVVREDRATKTRTVLAKGIASVDKLRDVVAGALEESSAISSVIVEPDLRAHYCPDRQKVIQVAVDRLIKRLQVNCPSCDARGFGPVRTIPGLRCAMCDLPTTRTAVDVMGCARCEFETEIARAGTADPTFCDRCNP